MFKQWNNIEEVWPILLNTQKPRAILIKLIHTINRLLSVLLEARPLIFLWFDLHSYMLETSNRPASFPCLGPKKSLRPFVGFTGLKLLHSDFLPVETRDRIITNWWKATKKSEIELMYNFMSGIVVSRKLCCVASILCFKNSRTANVNLIEDVSF